LVAAFNALFAAGLVSTRAAGRDLPERIGVGDIVLLGIATHKARLTISDFLHFAYVVAEQHTETADSQEEDDQDNK